MDLTTSILRDCLLAPNPLQLFRIFNLIVAGFGALMMLQIKTETSSREQPWTQHLGFAFTLFAVQYLIFSSGLPSKTERLFGTGNGYVWSELFGIPINLFLLSSARMLLGRRNWWPAWFFGLLAIDLVSICLAIFGFADYHSADLISTLCRATGDAISFITLMHFGYASYLNTRLNQDRSGIVLGLLIGIIYGGIHLISPFTPNIESHYRSTRASVSDVKEVFDAAFIFSAALFKLALLYSSFLIISLENRTLIKLRRVLSRSVNHREVFFSRSGILKAIIEAFQADGVKLYVKVPSKRDGTPRYPVHVYSAPSQKQSEYEIKDESDTPLARLLKALVDRRENASPKQRHGLRSIMRRPFDRIRSLGKHELFAGIEPILHHGALIGCLTIEKKGGPMFTYSAEQLCRALSEHISAVIEFYRVQESLRVLMDELRSETTVTPGSSISSANEMAEKFQAAIQHVLSPVRTRLVIDAGFDYSPRDEADTNQAPAPGCKRIPYPCVTDSAGETLTIGRLYLDYQRERDPIGVPSFGYFRGYGELVGSMVARSFLSSAEQRLNLLVRDLSVELAKRLDFEEWYAQIRKTAKRAGLNGCVIYDSEIREFSQLVRPQDDVQDRDLGRALAEEHANPIKLVEGLQDRPQVVLANQQVLIVGMSLRITAEGSVHKQGGIFLGIKRPEFVREISLPTPWRDFLMNFATVAGNARQRVIQARLIQRNQIQQAEDYMVLSAAEKAGLFTHELLNQIENLTANTALLKLDIPDTLEEPSRAQIISRIEEMRRDFDELRTLTVGIRSSAKIPAPSAPCSLLKTLKRLARLHESRTNVEIKLAKITGPSGPPGGKASKDVRVDLPADIVELIFGNLIRNSVSAIKRATEEDLGRGRTIHHEGLIQIWAEVNEGSGFVDCFVRDNGAGVPREIKDSIFDLNVSSTPGHGGWGLFYVRRKLEKNAGSIHLQHSEPGSTTFCVNLPLLNHKQLKRTDV